MGPAPEGPSPSCASLPAPMSRRSLRPQLNQIRGWVRQGRTDAWIAHQLDVTVQQIQAFKREQELEADGDSAGSSYEDVDLRAEDDAAIAAELEQEAARKADEVAHAADVLQGDLEHRQVEVEAEAAGARLRPGFQGLGWATERLVWMLLEGDPPPGPGFE